MDTSHNFELLSIQWSYLIKLIIIHSIVKDCSKRSRHFFFHSVCILMTNARLFLVLGTTLHKMTLVYFPTFAVEMSVQMSIHLTSKALTLVPKHLMMMMTGISSISVSINTYIGLHLYKQTRLLLYKFTTLLLVSNQLNWNDIHRRDNGVCSEGLNAIVRVPAIGQQKPKWRGIASCKFTVSYSFSSDYYTAWGILSQLHGSADYIQAFNWGSIVSCCCVWH